MENNCSVVVYVTELQLENRKFITYAMDVIASNNRDWLSPLVTGLRSPWHYSKCGNNKRIPHNAPDLDVFMSTVAYWVIAVSNENRFWCACNDDDDFPYAIDYNIWFYGNTIDYVWGMYCMEWEETGFFPGKYLYNGRF